MANKKTSKKPKQSLKSIPRVKLKASAPLKPYSATKRLKDADYIAEALTEALLEGDAEAFKEILSAHLDVLNKESFFKKAGVPRRTLFRMLSPEGNPTLDSIAKVIGALKKVA